MIGPTPRPDITFVNDALIRLEISYLDSPTHYREFLNGQSESLNYKWRAWKETLIEYGALGAITLVVVALVVLAAVLR